MPKVCKFLVEDISFTPNSIVPCGASNDVEEYFLKVDSNIKDVDFDCYFSKRMKYIEEYFNQVIPEFCKNCQKYSPIDINHSEIKIKKINIYNNTKCNCLCVYCCLADYGDMSSFKKMNETEPYDIKPILKKMDELNFIAEGIEIAIFGGECTVYPDELKYIIDWGKKYNAKFIILSNGIIYNKDIENLLLNGSIELRFSLDAGSKDLFEKIKRVKSYNIVHQNIERYSIAAKNNKNALIQLRYILCPGINTKEKEIKRFFEYAVKTNISNIVLSIDREWMQLNNMKKIPSDLKKSIKYYLTPSGFEHLARGIDSCEIWDWWLEKIINEESFLEKLKKKISLIKGF